MATAVSDHAVLRFLERECGLDIEGLRRTIGEITALGAAAGAPVVKLDGIRFVLVEGRVVTTLGRDQVMTWDELRQAMGAKRRG